MEDAALFAQIANRDEHAIETLSQRYGAAMHAVAYRVTHNERAAEEVVQDALMAVWRDPSRYDPNRGALGPWLLTLTRYKAIDAVRREQVISRHTAEVDLEFREAPDDVHDEVWLGIRRERLYEAIQRLRPDQRRALELAFLRGLTHVEVAEQEGIPLGTAKTRIRTALLRLRDYLGSSVSDDAPPRDADEGAGTTAPKRPTTPPRIRSALTAGNVNAGRAPPRRTAIRDGVAAEPEAQEAPTPEA